MSSDPYGLMASGLPPEIATRARGLTRQQAIAEAMLQQSQAPLETNRMAGGYVVPISPFEGLAKLAKGYVSRQALDGIDAKARALGNDYQSMIANEFARYMAKKTGTPESTIPAAPYEAPIGAEDSSAQTGAPVTVPATPADPRAAVMEAIVSRNPLLQKLGSMDYAQMAKPPEKYDAGDRWILMQDGRNVGEIPKNVSPDARLRADTTMQTHVTPSGSAVLQEGGATTRHNTASGSARLSAATALQTHVTPSGSAVLSAETQRRGQNQAVDPLLQGKVAEARSAGQATGEARAQAAVTLPTAVAKAEQSLSLVDQMIGTVDGKTKPHPGFSAVVGGTLVPGQRLIHGTPAANFDALFNQVKGGAFLEAFNSLKGAGAITDVEGKKGTEAITRMSIAQSEAEFIKAAREYQKVVSDGIGRMRQRATQGTPQVLRFDAQGNPIP